MAAGARDGLCAASFEEAAAHVVVCDHSGGAVLDLFWTGRSVSFERLPGVVVGIAPRSSPQSPCCVELMNVRCLGEVRRLTLRRLTELMCIDGGLSRPNC